MHAVFRDWMYARKARRQWQIQEYLIWRGGGSKFWFRRDCWAFLWPAEKAETTTCFSTCERRSPLVRGILLCEQRRTDHRRVHKQAQTRTGFQRFTEIGQIFHNKYIFNKKNFPGWNLENGLDKYFIRGELNWPISHLNDTETQERGLEGVKKFPGGACSRTPLDASALV